MEKVEHGSPSMRPNSGLQCPDETNARVEHQREPGQDHQDRTEQKN